MVFANQGFNRNKTVLLETRQNDISHCAHLHSVLHVWSNLFVSIKLINAKFIVALWLFFKYLSIRGGLICPISMKWHPTYEWKKSGSWIWPTLLTWLTGAAAGWDLSGASSPIRTIIRKEGRAWIAGILRKEGYWRNPQYKREIARQRSYLAETLARLTG